MRRETPKASAPPATAAPAIQPTGVAATAVIPMADAALVTNGIEVMPAMLAAEPAAAATSPRV